MADKPIIMSGESVRAIMAGLKTQTRRVIKPQPLQGLGNMMGYEKKYVVQCGEDWPDDARDRVAIPYQTGDMLWVRETWRPWSWREDEPIRIQYKSDGAIGICDADDEDWYECIAVEATNACERAGLPHDGEGYRWPDGKCPLPWRSPLFLPRVGSRLSLLVTDVRCQRVQDISEEDAIAEGMVGPVDAENMWQCGLTPRKAYAMRWDQLNAKRGHPFSANPWVFAYTFEVKS